MKVEDAKKLLDEYEKNPKTSKTSDDELAEPRATVILAEAEKKLEAEAIEKG